ncbi:MAG: hypothetical protein RMA76_38120 [Deltaproteobacteria bacterium]|jgi:hypothetical protein
MPIRTPEIASLFGALESGAFTDGNPMSAHLLRVMTMQRNRLITKPQVLFNLIWPTYDTSEVNGGAYAGFAPLVWTRITLPITVEKFPGHTRANVRLSGVFSSGHEMLFQVATRAVPFRANARSSDDNVISVTGTGSTQDLSIDGVQMIPGTREYFELWVRGFATAQAGATGTFGSPNSGDLEAMGADYVQDADSLTWFATGSGSLSWAEGGHYVEITDGSGNVVVPGREIVAVLTQGIGSGGQLVVGRPYSPSEVTRGLVAGNYAIYKLPEWALFNFMSYSQARTV